MLKRLCLQAYPKVNDLCSLIHFFCVVCLHHFISSVSGRVYYKFTCFYFLKDQMFHRFLAVDDCITEYHDDCRMFALSCLRRIFPLAVFGISLRNSTPPRSLLAGATLPEKAICDINILFVCTSFSNHEDNMKWG